MKFLQKTFIFFSCLSLGLTQLHGKSIDFLLENTTEKTISIYSASTLKNLEEQPNQLLHPDNFLYCPEITVENIGNQPIFDCFPYVDSKTFYSLHNIQRTLADSETPLIKLFALWKSSVIVSNTSHIEVNPFDLLNFQGYCSKNEYNQCFLKLCQSLGFEIRLANIHGKTIYDFSYRPGYWNLLDLDTHQFYYGLDNKTLISSEELMDDPLLILRNNPNIADAWKELSRFDILNPISAPMLAFDVDPIENRSNGFDLYPNDSLTLKTTSDEINLNEFQRVVQHKVDCKNRELESMMMCYSSPVPIYKIENCSTSPIIVDQHIRLEPSETYFIVDSQISSFKILFENNPEGYLNFDGIFAWKHYPILKNGHNRFNIGA
ncbi:MAG: hypothetical protein Q8K60_01280, partial [Parachlamydiaceae bacterium]|nr:hypothetical protein [Parachlamydiaceae bacterium]